MCASSEEILTAVIICINFYTKFVPFCLYRINLVFAITISGLLL